MGPCLRIKPLSAEERFDEFIRVEFCDVLGLFAQADEFHRDVELFLDGDDDAAAGGAVELGEHDAGDVDGFAKGKNRKRLA